MHRVPALSVRDAFSVSGHPKQGCRLFTCQDREDGATPQHRVCDREISQRVS